MRFYICFVRCLLVGMFMVASLSEAQESPWQSLAEIRAGTKVQVVENSLKSTSGEFMGSSEIDLTLKVDGTKAVIPRDHVYRVSVRGKNRKRNALIGLAIGAATGAGVGAAANRVVGDAWVIPGVMAGYAGLGAGVGALCPSAKTVYRAELPKQASTKEQFHPEQ